MRRLPKWFSSLDCLHTLFLFKTFPGEDPFPVLEKPQNLAILTLASSAFTSKDIKCTSGGFPKLKLLRVLNNYNWARWMPIEEGTMPVLQYLLIANCPRLTRLPDGFHHLTALQDLTLACTSAYFSDRLHEDDRWKVSHIRDVSIISQISAKGQNVTDSPSSSCDFPAIYNFGDSNSDTGGIAAAFFPMAAPCGETSFHRPVGRASDGRLIIDFIADNLGLPFLSPYLDSVGTNFQHGANLATGGATIRRPNESWFQTGV
ncbi:hypothetical protein ACH5RR_028755 [Cinchona calisaya]|uniref:Uncharacterized protein n=1 Tax=Cinchona calisaya TaxID=153742 RepID=A0ABD2YPQ0_9GENT